MDDHGSQNDEERQYVLENIVPRIWELVGTSCARNPSYNFTYYDLKDETELKVYSPERLKGDWYFGQ